MNIMKSLLYMFEHQALTEWFYNETEQFAAGIIKSEEFLYKLFNEICTSEGVQNPFRKQEFKTKSSKLNDHCLLIEALFPVPEESPLAYCAYMLFDFSTGRKGYYVVEKGNPNPFLCGWTSDMTHVNYGPTTFGMDIALNKAIELFNK